MSVVPVEEAWKMKYPEQIVFVVSIDGKGRPNVMSAGWFVPLSGYPPLLGIALANERYTRRLIRESGEFVVAFPTDQMAEEVLFCGTHTGSEVDKIEAAGLKTQPGTKTRTPIIKDGLANFECKLVNEVSVGDHTLFVGEILAAHVSQEARPRLFNFGSLQLKGVPPVF
jgi:flavin reductase (DIM6/NTAB) family NADH-FMN oxidoreductase RutF